MSRARSVGERASPQDWWANRLAAAMLSLLVCALGCVSESPTPDAYLILQPTLRGEEASVSLQLRHVESGSNLLIKAGRKVRVVAVPSGHYRILAARVPTMLAKRLATRSGTTRFEVASGRVAERGRVYLIAQTGARITGATGHAGSASARVALLCDPEVLAAAEAQAPEILAQHPLDRVCCEMDGDFEDFLRRGVMAVECPGE